MRFLRRMLKIILLHSSASGLYYKSLRLYKKGGIHRYYAYLINEKIQRLFACSLSLKANVGRNLDFKHPFAIVIGDGVVIGDDVTIYQSVTLGAARIGEGEKGKYPKIGDNVVIFAGAVIVGDVKVGNDSVIGANSVVTKDVPANTSVGGVPAKVLRKFINEKQ